MWVMFVVLRGVVFYKVFYGEVVERFNFIFYYFDRVGIIFMNFLLKKDIFLILFFLYFYNWRVLKINY